jgi:AcrR family transcriptional regulator
METPRRYAGVTADVRKAERLERLIQSAYDVFGREGYRKTTMRLICAQARLTERYFYEHFGGLDEIYLAVHRKTSTEAGLAVMSSLSGVADDPIEQTRLGLRAFFEFIKSDPRRGQILLLDAAASGLTTPSRLNQQLALFSSSIAARFKKRYPHLDFAPETELIVTGFGGMIIHTATLWMDRQFDWPVETLVDHNLYAWSGLHQWLRAHNHPPAPPTEGMPG